MASSVEKAELLSNRRWGPYSLQAGWNILQGLIAKWSATKNKKRANLNPFPPKREKFQISPEASAEMLHQALWKIKRGFS